MSEAEREAKLREMMGDADAHRAQQQQRARREGEEREAERAREAAAVEAAQRDTGAAGDGDGDDDAPAFLSAFAKETYKETNINSVADRINQQRYYRQKGDRE